MAAQARLRQNPPWWPPASFAFLATRVATVEIRCQFFPSSRHAWRTLAVISGVNRSFICPSLVHNPLFPRTSSRHFTLQHLLGIEPRHQLSVNKQPLHRDPVRRSLTLSLSLSSNYDTVTWFPDACRRLSGVAYALMPPRELQSVKRVIWRHSSTPLHCREALRKCELCGQNNRWQRCLIKQWIKWRKTPPVDGYSIKAVAR
jgi:hypothetical protein